MILIDFVPLIREMVMKPVTIKVLGKLRKMIAFHNVGIFVFCWDTALKSGEGRN